MCLQDLQSHVYGNPHSLHGELLAERGSSMAEAEARRLTLGMCNAPPGEYVCIFTSGATGMLACRSCLCVHFAIAHVLSQSAFAHYLA